MNDQTKVIACSLSGVERTQRAERWDTLGAYSVEQLDNGIRLVFAHDVESELQELAVLERECCAFADWDVSGNTIAITADNAIAVDAVRALGF
ncbi:MAG TPA: hypothetical protein VHQ89_05270 [Gaiellaceae bacterium]|jgi:hypothetical protein|nr:hypothetical protein [Gaiellaceae bacterium]